LRRAKMDRNEARKLVWATIADWMNDNSSFEGAADRVEWRSGIVNSLDDDESVDVHAAWLEIMGEAKRKAGLYDE
jgi:hypothetical protein